MISALSHAQIEHQWLENCSLHYQRTMQKHETTKSRLVVRHYQSWQDSHPNPAGPSNFSSVTDGMKRADREERDKTKTLWQKNQEIIKLYSHIKVSHC
jgi:hypothetical protein